jgi:hypothetical protein
MRSVPPREWLAVSLPVVFGLILLGGGAAAAADAGAWLAYALAALAGAAVPLAYTLRLMHERRLFLRDDVAVARSRVRTSTLIPLGWLLGVGLLVVSAALGGSAKTVFYAILGGAALGLWPGLVANSIRLWREEWSSTAAATEDSPSRRVPSKSR